SSGSTLGSGGCVTNKTRYIQYKVEFVATDAQTPILEDISLAFTLADVWRPPTNATNIEITNFTNGNWINSEPVITWDPAEDNVGGSGVLGYCVSLDEAEPDSSHALDPESNGGLLQGKDDGVATSACPYIVLAETFDLSVVNNLNLTSGKQYYFSIKAIDGSDNINNVGDFQDLISFKFDNTPPTPPSYVSMPTNFLSSKNVTISWASSGPGSAEDIHSGLAGLQYRIGPSGTWYGDLHTGVEDINDLLVNDGSYTTNPDYDYSELIEGTNFFYIRAIDNLGNVTADGNITTGLIKINTSAPSKILNLSVNNSNNTENSYAFDWDPPASFTGQVSGISYCYAINTIPDENSCTFTEPGVTELPSDAYATQPGNNTLYVVARDEASNINYGTYTETGASITFTYSGSAPGIPTNTDISDISIKATENWRLVISWNGPTNVGAGVSYYNVYRKVGEASCLTDFNTFTKVGSSNSTSYIDPDLQPLLYSYCIKACDSANNCSASSGTASRIPTGKFTEPALLASEVEVLSVTTRKALISWVTDRVSDSKIEYGLESGKYFEEEVSNSAQVISHNITLNNLTPGTSYFYRVKWTDVDGNIGVSDEKSFATLPPPVVSNVSASTITTNSAVINFRVRNATRVSLVYGTTESYGGSEEVATSTEESQYSVRLGNLVDGVTYNYKFFLQDIDGNNNDSVVNFQFQTLPLPEINNLRFEEVKNSSQPTVKVFWETNVLTLGFVQYVNQENISEDRTQAESEYANEHELTLIGLSANTNYTLTVSARDSLGNVAQSGEFTFTTASDSRPPIVSNVKIETRLSETAVEFGADVSAQLILTWDTDELATSQVQFAQGTSGDYTQKSALDENLTFNHLVVINNLNPSSVYKLQVLSKDDVGNEAKGKNIVTITAQSKENPLEVIFGRLSEVFGFLR
ncbi:fibronectin type III domain-containing protein, partial [Candidatus Dojkabacteria bacterium]|nr:fibronectin type III domain-containing protein [Candidatus Dojkabacteria bacterium]